MPLKLVALIPRRKRARFASGHPLAVSVALECDGAHGAASPDPTMQPSLKRYALLSLAAAVATIGLKAAAYAVTGSVGLLSDALESLVNLAAALIALYAISVAARPADEEIGRAHV